ncbi:MAG: S41 family peptidase, partial [Flavobacteriales bacterium]
PMSADRFLRALLPVLHRLGDGGITIAPGTAMAQRIGQEARLLPFSVRVLESGLYLADELKGFRTFTRGSRIISINGLGAERIVRELGAWVLCDGANETCRARGVEERFAWLFALQYGPCRTYVVEAEEPGLAIREETVPGLSAEEIASSRKPEGIGLHPWRSAWDEASGACWLQLTTLDPEALTRSGQSPRSFLRGLLAELRQRQPKALVIDVRGAGGRELGMAELVFSAIARESFRVVQGVGARATQAGAMPGLQLPDEHLAAIGRNYLPPKNGLAELRPDDPRLLPVSPMKKAFGGPVYVVCDGATRDAAAALAMLCKRTGRARLVGEELGTNAHAFTGGRQASVLLPNSGIVVRIPLLRYLPEGATDAPPDRGEQPHHRVEQQPSGLAHGRDTVRAALLELIRER